MKIKRYTIDDGHYHGELGFYCPACKRVHYISDSFTDIEAQLNGPWEFDKNFDNPTIQPSILVESNDVRCHSFITFGRINYCGDSSHEFAGIEMALPELGIDGEPESRLGKPLSHIEYLCIDLLNKITKFYGNDSKTYIDVENIITNHGFNEGSGHIIDSYFASSGLESSNTLREFTRCIINATPADEKALDWFRNRGK